MYCWQLTDTARWSSDEKICRSRLARIILLSLLQVTSFLLGDDKIELDVCVLTGRFECFFAVASIDETTILMMMVISVVDEEHFLRAIELRIITDLESTSWLVLVEEFNLITGLICFEWNAHLFCVCMCVCAPRCMCVCVCVPLVAIIHSRQHPKTSDDIEKQKKANKEKPNEALVIIPSEMSRVIAQVSRAKKSCRLLFVVFVAVQTWLDLTDRPLIHHKVRPVTRPTRSGAVTRGSTKWVHSPICLFMPSIIFEYFALFLGRKSNSSSENPKAS